MGAYKRLVALAFFALTGSSLLYLALPYILGKAVDKVVQQGHLSYLIYAGLAIIGIALLRAVFAFFENYLREALAQFVAYRIRNALYDHLQRMSFAYHDKQQTGHLMSRATADVENVRWFISLGVFRLSYMFLLIVGVTVAMATTNWWLALVSMGFIPIVVARAKSISGQLRIVWNRAQDHTAELSTILQESLTGIKVVKVFNRIDYENEKFAEKSRELNADQIEAAYLQARNTPFINFAFTGMTALILWLGGRQVLNGNMTAGELTQFIFYLALINMPVRMMGWMINLSARAVSSGQRIFEILDAESPVHDKPGAVELTNVRGHVTMENVSFSYDAASPVLRNITFEAQPGQVLALLGATGSGKSTVVHLLPRFYDATTGRVLIDGTDVRDVTLESLRRNVSIVQQDVFLFSDTIRNNIAYGAFKASDADVVEAAKRARLHDFIMRLPEKYETWVGERGITLSGGQKQRVAIARTLLMDPRVLILDDSTSSVDTRTEYLIRQALEALMVGRTTFVIAQRLSTLKNADMILVLDKGSIVQRGTHEQLLTQGGLYKSIYDLQLLPQEEARKLARAPREAAEAFPS